VRDQRWWRGTLSGAAGGNATESALPGGTPWPQRSLWLARNAAAFRFQFGDNDLQLAPGGYSNSGDEVG
jgi:hypothetical protein